jgi:hypothetical protein
MRLALAGKKQMNVLRSAQEKWHEFYQISISMCIDRRPKETVQFNHGLQAGKGLEPEAWMHELLGNL